MPTTASGPPSSELKPPEARPVRLHELDGMRGWAALSVVLYHLFWELFPNIVPGFRNPITSVLLDGSLAVWIFFVLSGEALSASYFAGGGEAAVLKLAVRRYTRLTLPIVVTCVVVFALIQAGLVFNRQAAAIVGRPDWLGLFLTSPSSACAYVLYALGGVYDSATPRSFGVPFLWTMHFEMLGSFMVFGLLLAWRHLRHPLAIVLGVAAAGLVFEPAGPFACFLFGVAFSQMRMRGFFAAAHRQRAYQIGSWIAVAVLAAGISYLHLTGGGRGRILLAAPFVFAVSCNRVLCDFLASAPSRLLGKLSFPLYLMQFPVLVSFTSWAIVLAARNGGLGLPVVWAINLGSVALIFAAAWLFLPVEAATRRVGDGVARRVLLAPRA